VIAHFAVTVLLAIVCGVQTFRISRLERRLDFIARDIEEWLRRQPASRTTERKGTEVTDVTATDRYFRRSWLSALVKDEES
jgi:hypothetical protein